jgi:hypothetical protein
MQSSCVFLCRRWEREGARIGLLSVLFLSALRTWHRSSNDNGFCIQAAERHKCTIIRRSQYKTLPSIEDMVDRTLHTSHPPPCVHVCPYLVYLACYSLTLGMLRDMWRSELYLRHSTTHQTIQSTPSSPTTLPPPPTTTTTTTPRLHPTSQVRSFVFAHDIILVWSCLVVWTASYPSGLPDLNAMPQG